MPWHCIFTADADRLVGDIAAAGSHALLSDSIVCSIGSLFIYTPQTPGLPGSEKRNGSACQTVSVNSQWRPGYADAEGNNRDTELSA